jgi:putative SOS response-associated peptidase YedK
MCGRFSLRARLNGLLAQYAVEPFKKLPLFERYNIPPTTEVPIVRLIDGQREISLARWGLIPSWTKDIKKAPMLNNARAETVQEKPSFRSAYKSRRCIIPASGFYEWLNDSKPRQPFYFHRPDDKLLSFAGLWESWNDIESCVIITTDANEIMAPIHERMPVILGDNDYGLWLDPSAGDATHLLAPCPASELTCYPVSTFVNNVRNQGPQCIERIQLQSNFLLD